MAKKDSQRIIEIREKANQQRREQQKRERRNSILIQLGIAVAVLLVVGAVVVFFVMGNNAPTTPGEAPSAKGTISLQGTDDVPFTVGDTAITIGRVDAPVTIDLFEDYSCPHCADYEVAVGSTLYGLAAKGDALVKFHPVQVVTQYGTNAGSAATCVAASDSQNWPDFHSKLFANHNQQSDSWSAKDFANFAKIQGITDEATLACIKKGTYTSWIGSNIEAFRAAELTGTPSLLINGKQVELLGPDGLIAAVNAAKGN